MSDRKSTNERRYRLIMGVLQDLIEGREVSWDVVRRRQLAAEGTYTADHFLKDRRWLKRTLEQFQEVFEPLGLPIPMPIMRRTSFSLPTRAFVRNFKNPATEDRKRLARAAVRYTKSNLEPLIPRSGAAYLGFGSQMYYLAREIVATSDSFDNSFSTNSFEIASLFYYAGPHILRREFYLPGSRLIYEDGVLSPHPRDQKFQTTIISADSVYDGFLYTSEPTAGALAENAIVNTISRLIIVIVDHTKLHRALGGTKIVIPADYNVQLVIDRALPDGFVVPKNWETHVVCN